MSKSLLAQAGEGLFFGWHCLPDALGTGVGATPVIPKEDAAVNRLRNVALSNMNQRRPSRIVLLRAGFLFLL